MLKMKPKSDSFCFHFHTRKRFPTKQATVNSKSEMQIIRIHKGHRFRMAAQPSDKLEVLADPKSVAALPAKIPHIIPRLKVSGGDTVKIGSPLFEDKRNTQFQFLSPAGGTVDHIAFGPRRAIEAIIINRDKHDEPEIKFPVISNALLKDMSRDKLVTHILNGGLWWTLRQMPFRDLCQPDAVPPLILVGLNALEPFQPNPDVYLQGRYDLLSYGFEILNKLSHGKVLVYAATDQHDLIAKCKSYITHTVAGNYPADDPGTVLYHIKKTAEENRAWYINGQDLLLLAELLSRGRYPVARVVSVAGRDAPVQQHFMTRMGVPLSHLVDTDAIDAQTRFVMGGLFRGHISGPDGFMGLYETALNLVPEGKQAEFLSLFKPGMRHPSYSRCFLPNLTSAPLKHNCNLNGSLRPCIACMHCADICPVDILPQMAHKAILAEEVEEALALGLLDCVACGLCSYVCPSKIELSQSIIAAKNAYAKEASGDSPP